MAGAGAGSREMADTALPASAAAGTANNASSNTRAVEETDLYRVEGDRLYFLNAYRGLMVFDISNIAAPRLLGRSPVYGSPVEMVVRNGIATIVLGDWYGTDAAGRPFYGSLVRGLDASNPANIVSLGETPIRGWVQDTRVVGDVLYAVSQDYGGSYGWLGGGVAVASPTLGGASTTSNGPAAIVSSVSFANRQIVKKSERSFAGWSGVMNVTANAVIFAHAANGNANGTELNYLDISDPQGEIVEGGSLTVTGQIGWGQDNGRWNLDFSDSTHEARVLTQVYDNNGNTTAHVVRADFSSPAAPVQTSDFSIPTSGWYVGAARFDGNKLYLAPTDYNGNNTPLRVVTLDGATNLAGSVSVPGQVHAFFPQGDRLFALGSSYSQNQTSNSLQLHYVNVTQPSAPQLLGSAAFGSAWGWSAAASTFKAFANNHNESLVALPFAGWDTRSSEYKNGVQVIEYTPTTITARGMSRQRGWVERGVFVKGKVVSLSDQALSVIDYSNRANPQTVAELVLARNVVAADVNGSNVSLLSTDWWGNSAPTELTVMPKASVEDDLSPAIGLAIPGDNARLLRAGTRGYIVTSVTQTVPCAAGNSGGPRGNAPTSPDGTTTESTCTSRVPRIQVVDFSGATPVLRGSVQLPVEDAQYYSWYGCGWNDWYGGADDTLVGDSTLFFRRYVYHYDALTNQGSYEQKAYVVNAANADAPAVASTIINNDPNGWWGNTRVVGSTVYTTHSEWVNTSQRGPNGEENWLVRYYLDRLDLSNPSAPRVALSVNVPGLLVGASEADPSLLYFVDYAWSGNQVHNAFNVARLNGNVATLESSTVTSGYLGNVFVRGNKAYASSISYPQRAAGDYRSEQRLVQFDLSTPSQPQMTTSVAKDGWGWLVDVQGDRAFVTSGWAGQGLDIYQLGAGAPTFQRFVRTRGWYANSLTRDGNDIYVSSGYYGVQKFSL